MRVDLGCLNRPWSSFDLGDTLDGIAAAGYKEVGFTNHQGAPVVSADSDEASIQRIKDMVGARGLKLSAVMGRPELTLALPEAVARFEQEIRNIRQAGAQYIILGGTAQEELYEKFYAFVEGILPCARQEDVTLVLKPHGGISALSENLLRASDRLGSDHFGICYDPGNIYYYTGQRAEDDLPKVADRVVAMCIKDERGGVHGEVMITPGTGVVDFETIFSILKDTDFEGPCWVECLGGETVTEINGEAKKTYRFMQDVVARVEG